RRRRHASFSRDWSSDVCSSDLPFGNQCLKSSVNISDRGDGFHYSFILEHEVNVDGLRQHRVLWSEGHDYFFGHASSPRNVGFARSEERRVGKEWGRRTAMGQEN